MDERSFEYWEEALMRIPREEWPNFRAHPRLYKDLDFLNLKFYERDLTLDGLRPQKFRSDHGEPIEEVPYGRPLSHLSTGRFSLRNKAVSHWAENSDIARCETMESLRKDNNLASEKIYDSSGGNPHLYGYFECRHISGEAKILDLTMEDCAFVKVVERLGLYKDGRSFFLDIVRSRDENVYPATQAIAEFALRNSYQGIIYRSVRPPVNVIVFGDRVLVLFDETLLKLPPYPEEISPRSEGTGSG